VASFKVFLSHSTKDGDFVKKLAAELKHEGIDPWLCEVDIIPGDNFVAEIEKGLSTSDLAIVVWSPAASRSRWTEVEWASVLDREISESRRRLSVVLLKDSKLPELLRTKIWIDARADADKGLRETVSWVKRVRDMRRDAGAKAPRCFLDYEPTDFVGRAEHLEALYAALAQKQGTFLLYGEPGSGKSTLALKFAWQAQGAFDAIVFQPCGQRTVGEIGVDLAAQLKLDVTSLSPEKQILAAKECLLGVPGSRSLLVLDDIRNNDVKELLPGPPVSVLCTSRQRYLPWIARNSTREVRSFSREEAETIFRIYLGEETAERHRTSLRDFAERVGRLPIAVVVAAAVLAGEFGPLDEATRGLRLERLRDEVHDVAGLLQRAVDSQPERERKLLKAMAACAQEDFWLPLAGEITALDEKDRSEARDQLVNGSLLRALDRDRQRFQLHVLLRKQLWKAPEMAALQEKHAMTLERLFRDWETRWKECRECLPEIIPAMEFLWKVDETLRADWLAFWGYATAKRIGELEPAFRILKELESFRVRQKDKQAKKVLCSIYGNQALILRVWGRPDEAMELLKKQEALCLETAYKYIYRCYGNQAIILREWGRLDEAMELLKKEEALCLQIGDKSSLAKCYGEQALILDERGRPDEAMELLKKEEALCLQIGDKDGLQTCYSGKSGILQDWGRLDEAMELLKKQEALCLELGSKKSLGRCYWSWGFFAKQQNDRETAKKKLKAALDIFTELNMRRERDAVKTELEKSEADLGERSATRTRKTNSRKSTGRPLKDR